jgi:hypothetical protein
MQYADCSPQRCAAATCLPVTTPVEPTPCNRGLQYLRECAFRAHAILLPNTFQTAPKMVPGTIDARSSAREKWCQGQLSREAWRGGPGPPRQERPTERGGPGFMAGWIAKMVPGTIKERVPGTISGQGLVPTSRSRPGMGARAGALSLSSWRARPSGAAPAAQSVCGSKRGSSSRKRYITWLYW